MGDATMLPGKDALEEDDEEENKEDDEMFGVNKSGSGEEFTSFPLYPPEECKRRSSTAKKTWPTHPSKSAGTRAIGFGKANPTPTCTRRLHFIVQNVPWEVL